MFVCERDKDTCNKNMNYNSHFLFTNNSKKGNNFVYERSQINN